MVEAYLYIRYFFFTEIFHSRSHDLAIMAFKFYLSKFISAVPILLLNCFKADFDQEFGNKVSLDKRDLTSFYSRLHDLVKIVFKSILNPTLNFWFSLNIMKMFENS